MDHDTKRFRLPRLRSEDDQGRDPNKNYEELDQLFDQAVKKSRHKRITTYASKKQHSTGPAYTSVRKTPRKVEQMKTSEVDTELVNIGLHQKDVGEWRQTQFEYKQNLITRQPDREGEESNTDFLPNLKSPGKNAPSESAQNSDEPTTEVTETAATVEMAESNRNKSDLLQALLRFEKIAQDQREQEAARAEDKEDSTEAFREAYEEMIEESDGDGIIQNGSEEESIERESAGFNPEEVSAQGETEGTKEEQSDLQAEAFDITPPAHDLDDTENFGLIEQPERHEIEGFEEQEEALVNRFFQEMEIPEPIGREDESSTPKEPESYDLGLISEKPLSANFDQGLYYNENSRPEETQTEEDTEAFEEDMDELDWEASSAELLDENAFYAPFNLDSSDSWTTPDREKKEEEKNETPQQPAEQTKAARVLTPEQEAAREKRREELKQKFIAQKKQAAMSEAAERGRLAYATEKKEMAGQTAATPHRSEFALFKEALEDESIRKAFYIALLGLVLFAAFVLVFRSGFNNASWVMAGTLLVVLILTSDTDQRSTLIMLALTLVLFLFIEFYQIFAQGYALHIFDYLWFILTPICTMTCFAFFHDYREWKLEQTAPMHPIQENPEAEESEGNESEQKKDQTSKDRKTDEPENDHLIQALAREESGEQPAETETVFEDLSDTTEPESDSLFMREEASDEDGEDTRSETQEILLHLMNLEGRKSGDESDPAADEANDSETAEATSDVFEITPLEPIEAESEDPTDTTAEDEIPVELSDSEVAEEEVLEEEVSDQETEPLSEAADEKAEKKSDQSENQDIISAGEFVEETKETSKDSQTYDDEKDEHHDHPIDHFESLTQPIQIISMDSDKTSDEDEASDSKTKSASDHNAWIATELSDLNINVNENQSFHNESLTEQEAKQFEQDFSFFFDFDDDEDE